MRTHYCGNVDETLTSQEVTVAGWVHRRRDHGGVIFVDLRDREGLVQVVFDPDSRDIFSEAERLRSEFVIQVKGKVRARPAGTVNANLRSGQVELLARELVVLNRSEPLPFQLDEHVSEEVRLKYRYLDLRREVMTRRLRQRHHITRAMRGYLDSNGAAPTTSLTSIGLLMRYYIDGWRSTPRGFAEGVKGLMAKAPTPQARPQFDMYFYYYATQVVRFYGKEEWSTWNDGPKAADGTRKGDRSRPGLDAAQQSEGLMDAIGPRLGRGVVKRDHEVAFSGGAQPTLDNVPRLEIIG